MRKRALVVDALHRQRLDFPVDDVLTVPPNTRRRATFKVAKSLGATEIGFHAAATHRIVDMHECQVLTPRMVALVSGLRQMMDAILRDNEKADLGVTETETGFDVLLAWQRKPEPALISQFARWAERLGIARVSAGKEILVSVAPPLVHLAGVELKLPAGAFLQPSASGEMALQSRVAETFKKARQVADLFCGCGTFTFALARQARVHAVDSDTAMLSALREASARAGGLKQITTERRNLFRQPLNGRELSSYDAIVLDPPRAGALAQTRVLGEARVPSIAYVSCNADSFARDAAVLVQGGYKPSFITPVDQFLWSEHIELVAVFERLD